jgi:hypothetical protein
VRFTTFRTKQKGDKYGCKVEKGTKASGEGKRDEKEQVEDD